MSAMDLWMWEDVQPGAVTASGIQGRRARDETMF